MNMPFAESFQKLFGGAPNPMQQPMTAQQAANPNNAQPVNPAATRPTGVADPTTGLPGTQQSATTDANGMVPSQPQNLNNGAPGNSNAVSPLDPFAKIWETPPVDPKANQPMFAGLDAAKLMEQASRIEFSKAVTPEMMAKINAGGPEAMQTMVEAMNKIGQTVYAQAAFATTKIVEKAATDQRSRFESDLPNMVKKFSVNENLVADNPILNSPAVAPLVDALRTVLIQKNPNASGAEIQSQVVDYFKALGQTFAIAPPTPKSKASAAETDWDAFMKRG